MEGNLSTYNSRSVVKWYNEETNLAPVEKKIFEKYAGFMADAHVLDIGIGGGRTTRYLITNCKKYTGIDYSENFIKAVKNKYPTADLSLMDARHLLFPEKTFDFVNFSFNGIDYVSLEDRQKIMSEISRVLKPNGIFFFSTHNKNHASFNKSPWLNKTVRFYINLKSFVKLIPFVVRKLRNKSKEIIEEDYAIINDSAHNYQLMTFYTSVSFLKRQLLKEQFSELIFYTKAGEKVPDENLDDWIFVTCKKTGT